MSVAWRQGLTRSFGACRDTGATRGRTKSSVSLAAEAEVSHWKILAPPPRSVKLEHEEFAERLKKDAAFASRVAVALGPRLLERMTAKAEEAASLEAATRSCIRPTNEQLLRLALRQAVPFIGFGLFDNMVMITVGDAVDSTFGLKLGLSTLAAAGVGQMASDSVGITLQGVIERFADRLRLPDPGLTPVQEQLSLCKTVVQISRTVGIVFGCFMGMFPLLFLEHRDARLVDQVVQLLPEDKQGEFWSSLEPMSYEKGEKILVRGEEGRYLHLIVHGEAEVVGVDRSCCEIHVCDVCSGSTIGELEFVSGDATVADVVAVSPVRTQRLAKDDFIRIAGDQGLAVLKEQLVDSRYIYYRMSAESDASLFLE